MCPRLVSATLELAMVDVVYNDMLPVGGLMVLVVWLGPKVGGQLYAVCIVQMNGVNACKLCQMSLV